MAAFNKTHLKNISFILFLLLIALTSYRFGFDVRGPVDEEIVNITFVSPEGPHLFGLFWVDFAGRIFHFVSFGLVYKLVGENMWAYFLLMPTCLFLCAVFMWATLRRIAPAYPLLAMASAVIFLAYPSDPTRTLMTLLGNLQAMTFFMAAVWLASLIITTEPAQSRISWWVLIPAALIFGTLSYDQMLPLIVLLPVLAAYFVYKHEGLQRTIRLAALWYGAVVAIVVWRFIAVFVINRDDAGFVPQDEASSGSITDTIAAVFARADLAEIIEWVRVGVVSSWFRAGPIIREMLALRSPTERDIALGIAALIFIVVFAWGVLHLLSDRTNVDASGKWSTPTALTVHSPLALSGLLLGTAGFAFIIWFYDPPVDSLGIFNRYHTVPSLGFSVFWGAVLSYLSVTLSNAATALSIKYAQQIGSVATWGIVTVMVGTGIIWHIGRAQYWDADWDYKARLWTAILEEVPQPDEGTLLFIVDPPNPDDLRLYEHATWMAHVLYDNRSISADLVAGNHYADPRTQFHPTHAELQGERFDYEDVVFIEVTGTREGPTAHVLDCLPEDLNPGNQPICNVGTGAADQAVQFHDWLSY